MYYTNVESKMFDDSKNASSWEVVGGKGGSGGKKNKTDQKKKDGTSKNGGSQPVKVVKVDELGTFNLLYDKNFFLCIDSCISPIFLQLLHWIPNMLCW